MDGQTPLSHQDRLRRRYQGVLALRGLSPSLPGRQTIGMELVEGTLVPVRSRRRWSILGRYVEVFFRLTPPAGSPAASLSWYEETFRLRTPFFREPRSVLCGFWPQPLGREPNRYREAAEVVDTDTDERFAVSPAAQFGPYVWLALLVGAAVAAGLLR